MWPVIGYFWGQILDLGPVDWEWVVQLGTKAMSPIWEKAGSVGYG